MRIVEPGTVTFVTLIPEPGKDYEMELQVIKISTFKAGCVIAVRQLSTQTNTTVETSLRPQVCAKTPSGWFTSTLRLCLEMPEQDAGEQVRAVLRRALSNVDRRLYKP